MFCQHCGSRIPDGDQFCGQCGARSGAAAGASPGTTPTGASAEGARPGDPLPTFGARDQREGTWRNAYFEHDPNAMAQQYEYASFGIRLGAWLLDVIFAWLMAAIPAAIIAVILYALVESNQEPALTRFEQRDQDDWRELAAGLGFFIPWFLVVLGYWYVATAVGGGWGKRICGARIVKQDTGARPGYGSAAIRVGIVVLMGVVFWPFAQIIDYMWMLWDQDKQTLHDKAAGTVVVRV